MAVIRGHTERAGVPSWTGEAGEAVKDTPALPLEDRGTPGARGLTL
jgi:hypothetical protein